MTNGVARQLVTHLYRVLDHPATGEVPAAPAPRHGPAPETPKPDPTPRPSRPLTAHAARPVPPCPSVHLPSTLRPQPRQRSPFQAHVPHLDTDKPPSPDRQRVRNRRGTREIQGSGFVLGKPRTRGRGMSQPHPSATLRSRWSCRCTAVAARPRHPFAGEKPAAVVVMDLARTERRSAQPRPEWSSAPLTVRPDAVLSRNGRAGAVPSR